MASGPTCHRIRFLKGDERHAMASSRHPRRRFCNCRPGPAIVRRVSGKYRRCSQIVTAWHSGAAAYNLRKIGAGPSGTPQSRLASWWGKEVPHPGQRQLLRRLKLGVFPEIWSQLVKRNCRHWDKFTADQQGLLMRCPCNGAVGGLPQDARHALFECEFTTASRVAAVQAMDAAAPQGAQWRAFPPLAKFNAMMAPWPLKGMPADTSQDVRRAGIQAWAGEMDISCGGRQRLWHSNAGFPDQVRRMPIMPAGRSVT